MSFNSPLERPRTGIKRRWPLWLLALLILALTLASLRPPPGPKPPAPSVTVLASWTSNSQQFVTLRLDPTNTEFTFLDLVSDTYDSSRQPKTTRSFGTVFPVRDAGDPPCNIRVVAMPLRGPVGLAYTPGSYTIAFASTNPSPRLRVGVAQKHTGPADYSARLRNCWYRRALWPLLWQAAGDPVFIVLDSVTNFPSPYR